MSTAFPKRKTPSTLFQQQNNKKKIQPMDIVKLSLSKESYNVGSKTEPSISSTVPYNHSLLLAFFRNSPVIVHP